MIERAYNLNKSPCSTRAADGAAAGNSALAAPIATLEGLLFIARES